MKVLMAAACGPRNGLGHLMRSKVLAKALAQNGHDVTFWLCSDDAGDSERFIGSLPASVSLKPDPSASDWPERISAALSSSPVDWLILDGYGYTGPAYLEHCREAGAKLLMLDDIGDRTTRADVVLNPNVADTSSYEGSATTADRFLVGPEHLLIGDDYSDAGNRRDEAASSILFTFGGIDTEGNAQKMARLLDPHWPLEDEFRIVVGPYTDVPEDFLGNSKRAVSVLRGLTTLAPEMRTAAVVFTTASTTAWQACCSGVPVVAVVAVDNQREAARTLAGSGAALVAEKHDLDHPARMEELVRQIANSETRSALARQGRKLVDGQGAARVTAVLEGVA